MVPHVLADAIDDHPGLGGGLGVDLAGSRTIPVEILGDDLGMLQVTAQSIESAVTGVPGSRAGDLRGSRIGIHTANQNDQRPARGRLYNSRLGSDTRRQHHAEHGQANYAQSLLLVAIHSKKFQVDCFDVWARPAGTH